MIAVCLGIAAIVGFVAVTAVRMRDFKVDSLYSDLTTVSVGSTEQIDDVKQIATYPTTHATRTLLRIAHLDGSLSTWVIWPGTRIIAIQSLHRRGGAEVTDSIAHLIQPHEPLVVRRAAADEILSRNCGGACMTDVLHFLEREMNGTAEVEKRQAGEFDYLLNPDRMKLHSTLMSVVKKNDDVALTTLRDVYGLGSLNPSEFVVKIVSLGDIKRSCPFLLDSASFNQKDPDPALIGAIQSLSCTPRSPAAASHK